MNFLKEFRDFAVKGNMLDMAVGIVIGAAITAIVSSMVDDGNFINALVKFTIVAFALFMVVKAVNNIRRMAEKEKKQEAAAPAVPPREVVLLEEIRDLLAKRG
jgi:large conductance mechanosensitive channel